MSHGEGACENEACDGERARLTGVKEYALVALVFRAGTDKKPGAHSLDFFHFTLAVVVVIQDQPVQLVSRVVADGVEGDVGIRLPPYQTRKKGGGGVETKNNEMLQLSGD